MTSARTCVAACKGPPPERAVLTMLNRESPLIRVGRDTLPCHAPADADRLALMDVTSVAQYRRFLARIHGLESAVELEVSGVVNRHPTAASLRGRIGRLHDDLVALGLSTYDVAALPRCPQINIYTRADALGWLYVLERGCLVSGLIRRHLAIHLPEAIENSARYLDTAIPSAGHQLRTFGDLMAQSVRRDVIDPAQITAAARRAFQLQRHWYAPIVRLRTRSSKNARITAPSSAPPVQQAG